MMPSFLATDRFIARAIYAQLKDEPPVAASFSHPQQWGRLSPFGRLTTPAAASPPPATAPRPKPFSLRLTRPFSFNAHPIAFIPETIWRDGLAGSGSFLHEKVCICACR